MNAVEIMMAEHRQIERVLGVVRKVCFRVLQGKEIPYDDFESIIDFVRNYSDAHHHGKEEKFLFNRMIEHLGPIGEKLIRAGMLVEHDLGRLYMKDLEEALERVKAGDEESKLDVIANAISYTHLLQRHIAKEDEVVYTFALRQLPEDVMEEVNRACRAFEKECEVQGVQRRYLDLVEALETKYC